MIRYIALELSADGPPPSHIDRLMRQHGLVRDGPSYRLEAGSEGELDEALDRLHAGLRGTGARYRIGERPDPRRAERTSGAEVMRWVEAGVVDERALDLLDGDEDRFRQEALQGMGEAVDRVLDLRRDEAEDKGYRRLREAAMEDVSMLLRTSGERTFQEILDSFDMDAPMLEAVLEEMIDRGEVEAAQKGHAVTYRRSGPLLRSADR